MKTQENAQLKEEAAQREREMETLQQRITELEEKVGEGQGEIRRLKAELRDSKNKLAQAVLSLVDPEFEVLPETEGPAHTRRRRRSLFAGGSGPAGKLMRATLA